MMFDQLYVLARGGVCIYSGPTSQIQSHLSQIPDLKSTESKFAIEELINLSCDNHKSPLIQKLVLQTNKQFSDLQTLNETKQIPSLTFQSQTTFNAKSSYILALRYFALFRCHLWKEWFLFYVVLVSFSFSLEIFWGPEIALTSGCLKLESAYLNGSCSQTDERVKQEKALDDTLKYNFFMNNIFLLLILLQSSLMFFKEIKYFQNEHKNGEFRVFYIFFLKF